MGGDEACSANLDAHALRRHAIGLGHRLQALDAVGGERLLEQLEESGVAKLGLGHLGCGVRQGGQVETGVAESIETLRLFLRTLRSLRDLRRYASPVVVQNAARSTSGRNN
jgi:hypothetical protein